MKRKMTLQASWSISWFDRRGSRRRLTFEHRHERLACCAHTILVPLVKEALERRPASLLLLLNPGTESALHLLVVSHQRQRRLRRYVKLRGTACKDSMQRGAAASSELADVCRKQIGLLPLVQC